MDKINIEIDERSGFCYGVVRAIEMAEKVLGSGEKLVSLGAIVHNGAEIERLSSKGLVTVDSVHGLSGKTVLIRAHGEPPETYEYAKSHDIKVIDCTCPVVLKLQSRIRTCFDQISRRGGTVVIFGKLGHAEINGLVGQTGGNAVVVESLEDLDSARVSGKIDYAREIALFSQTTKDPQEYSRLAGVISKRIEDAGGSISLLTVNKTICSQVSSRHGHLEDFASRHDIVLFVSGNESSNGKVLYGICKNANPRSYKIEKPEDISPEWIKEGDNVGICGATSTPKWQLEATADYIKSFY